MLVLLRSRGPFTHPTPLIKLFNLRQGVHGNLSIRLVIKNVATEI